MDEKLHKKLEDRREKGTLRSLSSFEEMTDFFSNDYLGLSGLQMDASNDVFGGTGSRLISGTSERMLDIEQSLANFFGFESSLMFNSGYDANIGFFGAVPQRGDTIVYDELIHASVRDGVRLSLANGISFKHNSGQDLERKIKSAKGAVYVVVESLYSMDGDIAPLESIASIVSRYSAYLIVDEAHACGVYGADGRGLVTDAGIERDVFAKLVTFGKAFGSHGAILCGGESLIQFLVNYARSFIYTTALPPSVFERNYAVVSSSETETRKHILHDRITYFRSKVSIDGLISHPSSPIQIVEIGDVTRTQVIAERIQESQIAIKPIYSPTVPEGRERLRICIHSFNTLSEIDELVRLLGIKE